MAITEQRAQELLRGLSHVAHKVYDLLPTSESGEGLSIRGIQRKAADAGYSNAVGKIRWAVESLVESGLVREQQRDTFSKVAISTLHVKAPKPFEPPVTQLEEQLKAAIKKVSTPSPWLATTQPQERAQEQFMAISPVNKPHGDSGRKGLTMLSMLQSAKLIQLIQDTYASSGLNDTDFAAHVADQFKGVKLTAAHIINRRTQLDIPNNRAKLAAAKASTKAISKQDAASIMEMLAQFETRLVALERRGQV